MNWDVFVDWSRWLFAVVFIPIIGWLEKKRKEFNSLSDDVKTLKQELESTNERIDNINTKIDDDREVRRRTEEKIDKIYDVVSNLQAQTAVNAARLEERNK